MTNQAAASMHRTTTQVFDNRDGESLKKSVWMGSRMMVSRLIGSLFLAGFVVYGVGFGLVTSVISVPDFLLTLPAHQTTLILGAFLMLLNTAVDIGKGVLFFPILENHGKRTALTYLAALTVQVVLLDIGVLCLLMLVPLSQYAVDAGGAERSLGRSPRVTPDRGKHPGLPDRPGDARRRGCIPLCAAVPDPADPPILGGLGCDRLRDSRGGRHRRDLRVPHQPHALDPRWTL